MKVQEGKPYQKHTGKITRSACAVGEINGDNADTLNCEIKKGNQGDCDDVWITFTTEDINSRTFPGPKTVTLHDDS